MEGMQEKVVVAEQADLDDLSGQAGKGEPAMSPERHLQPAGAGHENSDMHSPLNIDPCMHLRCQSAFKDQSDCHS